MSLWLVLAINSITLGGLLFLLSAGFSLIFGLMKIPNLTHGSFFMLGAYLTFTLVPLVGFWPAIPLAALIVGVFGMVFEFLLIRPLYGRLPEYTLLLTYGMALVFAQFVRWRWGDDAVRVAWEQHVARQLLL